MLPYSCYSIAKKNVLWASCELCTRALRTLFIPKALLRAVSPVWKRTFTDTLHTSGEIRSFKPRIPQSFAYVSHVFQTKGLSANFFILSYKCLTVPLYNNFTFLYIFIQINVPLLMLRVKYVYRMVNCMYVFICSIGCCMVKIIELRSLGSVQELVV